MFNVHGLIVLLKQDALSDEEEKLERTAHWRVENT